MDKTSVSWRLKNALRRGKGGSEQDTPAANDDVEVSPAEAGDGLAEPTAAPASEQQTTHGEIASEGGADAEIPSSDPQTLNNDGDKPVDDLTQQVDETSGATAVDTSVPDTVPQPIDTGEAPEKNEQSNNVPPMVNASDMAETSSVAESDASLEPDASPTADEPNDKGPSDGQVVVETGGSTKAEKPDVTPEQYEATSRNEQGAVSAKDPNDLVVEDKPTIEKPLDADDGDIPAITQEKPLENAALDEPARASEDGLDATTSAASASDTVTPDMDTPEPGPPNELDAKASGSAVGTPEEVPLAQEAPLTAVVAATATLADTTTSTKSQTDKPPSAPLQSPSTETYTSRPVAKPTPEVGVKPKAKPLRAGTVLEPGGARTAFVLALTGAIPFVAGTFAIWVPIVPEAYAYLVLPAVLWYGAVILSFLGGIRWGLALRVSNVGRRARLMAFSVVPSLLGWFALFLPPEYAVIALIIGFAGQGAWDVATVEHSAAPTWFTTLRLLLTIIVVACFVFILLAVSEPLTLDAAREVFDGLRWGASNN